MNYRIILLVLKENICYKNDETLLAPNNEIQSFRIEKK